MANRWLSLAGGDQLSANSVLSHQDTALRNVGLLAQQAAEKALKSSLPPGTRTSLERTTWSTSSTSWATGPRAWTPASWNA